MKYKIFATTSAQYLVDQITHPLLIPLKSKLITETFSDKEIAVKFPNSVRGCNLFLFCNTSSPQDIIELMFSINATYLAAAKSVALIFPYFGYCRQDRQESARGSLGAALIAKMITSRELASVVSRVVTIDLHAEQEQGFFNTPCEHIRGHAIFLDTIRSMIDENTILCSPDAGGTKRVEKYMSRLKLSMVSINKRREKPNEIAGMELSGDVTGKNVIIIDDIIDTCGTLLKAVAYLKERGADKVTFIATHGVLSGKAYENLKASKLNRLIISDTVEVKEPFKTSNFKDLEIKVIPCMPIIEKVILNLIGDTSISQLND